MLRILAPTDFSMDGYNATLVAMRLAQRFGSQVIFVHAMAKPPVPANSPENLFQSLYREEEQKNLEKLREECQHLLDILNMRHGEIHYKTVVVPTPFAESMLEVIYREKIDLVVMGSRGSTSLRKILLGSSTQELMRLTTVPLLIIPSFFVFDGFKRVTILLQHKAQSYRPGVKVLERLASSYNATLHFLIMTQDGRQIHNITEICTDTANWQYLLEFPHSISSMAETDTLAGLKDHMAQKRTDLIVLFPDRRSIWEDFFSQNIADDLAAQPKVPILILPNQ
ncbi:universal stress protein [Pontibacter sp. JH31]|uniref:Universal stress protein n=1 Tax=Pontibacter aquaedesilientis TaxID=2766980 RepID=A0ABR7XD81_9BACT|nr:universal stress protein [Pontibacter aquaedesilientis]MBD1396239.1 universal stress protein [Pontibacter aquaedesilientis]